MEVGTDTGVEMGTDIPASVPQDKTALPEPRDKEAGRARVLRAQSALPAPVRPEPAAAAAR